MLKSKEQHLTVYKDDYKPINVYNGRKKIAGYKEEQHSGKSIEVEDTYNDLLDCKVKGHHEQDSRKAYWWNQIFNIKENYQKTRNGITITSNTDGTVTVSGTESSGASIFGFIRSSNDKIFLNVGHKYLFSCRYEGGSNNTYDFRVQGYMLNFGKDVIFTATDSNTGLQVCIRANQTINVTVRPMIIDLTAMFGEGKEPTVEQFRKMFPCDYYPYNAGEWRYANGGQYINFNQLNKMVLATSPVNGVNQERINTSTLHYTGNATVTTTYTASGGIKIIQGHKYFLSLGNSNLPTGCRISNSNTDKYYCVIYKSNVDTTNFNFGVRISTGFDFDFIVRPIAIDLTQMFGEGNEPTTVEEFKALYPEEYYDYVESRYEYTPGYYEDGQVVEHIPDTAFDTPFPEMPEEVRCVKDAKVDISSNHLVKGFDNKNYIIPFELYGANGINDEVEPCVLVDGEWKCRVTRRWGEVDLGTLNWSRPIGSNNKPRFNTSLNTIKLNTKNICCSIYKSDSYTNIWSNVNNYTIGAHSMQHYLVICNNDYDDSNIFKSAMSGIYIHYELEIPTIELYPPIPIRTLPINTIINSDAELECNIKTVDKCE